MSDMLSGNPNHIKRAQNLAKLKNALEIGRYIDANGKEQSLPLKADGTVARDTLASGLGFARSAFQKATKMVKGQRVKVESEFAEMLDAYDLNTVGKFGSEWGGKTKGGRGIDRQVHDLFNRIQELEQRRAVLQLELDEANAKLASLGYISAELDDGSVRLPW